MDETDVEDDGLVVAPDLQPAADVPAATRAAISDAVDSLILDTYVDANVRHEAFMVARLLRGDHYTKLLSDLADQAELEGTPLLAEAQAERRRLHQ